MNEIDYKQKYEQALERAKGAHNSAKSDKENGVTDKITGYTIQLTETIFPELKESDERIRKELISHFVGLRDNVSKEWYGIKVNDIIAWLEKQGEQPNKVSIWKHWKNGIAGNREGKLIYLVKSSNTYRISSCLSFECDYIELSELDSLMLEKQGEQKSWSKEDENGFSDTLYAIQQARSIAKDENDMGNLWYAENWLKSIKERMKGE